MGNPITPRTTTVVIFQGDDYDQFERLRKAVEQAATEALGDNLRLNDAPPVKVASEEYDAFVAEATERGRTVTVTAIPRRGAQGFRSLLMTHPAREDHETDKRYGFNFDTMADDLVPASLPVEQFGSIGDRDAFLDVVSDGDWSRLYDAAITVNQGGSPDPKAPLTPRLVSSSDPTSDEKSKPPQRLG